MKIKFILGLLLLCNLTNAQVVTDSVAIKKSCFQSARNEIKDMLDGKTPLNYEKAVFIMENAWSGNTLSYEAYQNTLEYYTDIIKDLSNVFRGQPEIEKSFIKTEEMQFQQYETALMNYTIFKFINDTTYFLNQYDTVTQTMFIEQNLPFTYSFSDPFGTTDWKNTQLIHLMQTKKGNCFALASMFKVLADRLNSNAQLCTAPGHIYIRHANEKGIYFNVELATGTFPGTGSLKTLTYSISSLGNIE
ncbi:MAG TPA: hypothetical protein VD905_20795 [Flavobacteriales bacterium]|nr:hypothetical protein [Flavobacteriales bacterium]